MSFVKMLLKCAVIFLLFVGKSASSRILCAYPFPSVNHQNVFRVLSNELANRGHELVVITTDLTVPNGKPHPNITEIDVSATYKAYEEIFSDNTAIKGIKFTPDKYLKASKVFVRTVEAVFTSKGVKDLIEDKKQKFDLVIADGAFEEYSVFGKIYNAPVIQFSTLYGQQKNYAAIGAPANHPYLYPSIYRQNFGNLTLWERILETYLEISFYKFHYSIEQELEEVIKRTLGDTAPSRKEIRDSIALMFVNVNPIFEGNRPVPPNVVHLGYGFNLKKPKELTKELKSFLDSSKNGVVFVNFGSNIRPRNMHKDLLEELLKGFESLPYNVLWQFDRENLHRVPKNVMVQKWLPENDVLHHPKIVAFVTQCDLQSTDEAIHAGVPFVGTPLFGEQFYTAERYVNLGIGVKIDVETLTAESFGKAVGAVAKDESYRNNIKNLRTLMEDQTQTPLERAIWWTEYVIRNKGAPHLRAPAFNSSWADFIMLDVLLIFIGNILPVSYILVVFVRVLLAWKNSRNKVKTC